MKPGHITLSLAAGLLSVTPIVSAWPGWLPDYHSLVARQEDTTDAVTAQPTPQPTANNDEEENVTDTPAATARPSTNLNVAIPTSAGGSVTRTGSPTGTGTRKPTHVEFAPDSPPGAVVMVTPAVTAGTNLYKVGDPVTFGWTYTNLQGEPSAIDVYVSCSEMTETWTLTQNMTFATEAAYTWDTNLEGEAAQTPLLTYMYTLIVADAEAGISATPEAGYLSPYSGFRFGMYTPLPYVPYDQWECTGCKSGAPGLDTQAIGLLFSVTAVTILSFTWFVAGFGVVL